MKPNNLSALLLAGCCLLPAMASALPSDSEQPIHIQADTAELDDKKGTAIYRGDVVITQGTLKITGHTVTLVQGKDRKSVVEGKRVDLGGGHVIEDRQEGV